MTTRRRRTQKLHDWANDGNDALKWAAEDRGWKHRESMSKPALQRKTMEDDDDDDGTPSMTGSNQFPNLPINPLVKQRKL